MSIISKIKSASLPHIISIFFFLVLSFVFLKPAMEGKVLKQSDIIQFKGAARAIIDHEKNKGEVALWTKALFSGMPTYQIRMNSENNTITIMVNYFNKLILCIHI